MHTGARMLRQDPVECLFQFICSSNNHISRIHGMVERLCATYGTPLTTIDTVEHEGGTPAAGRATSAQAAGAGAGAALARAAVAAATGVGAYAIKPETATSVKSEAAGAPASPPATTKRQSSGPHQNSVADAQTPGTPAGATVAGQGEAVGTGGKATPGLSFYAFPSLEQLAAATEEELRAMGFGWVLQ